MHTHTHQEKDTAGSVPELMHTSDCRGCRLSTLQPKEASESRRRNQGAGFQASSARLEAHMRADGRLLGSGRHIRISRDEEESAVVGCHAHALLQYSQVQVNCFLQCRP